MSFTTCLDVTAVAMLITGWVSSRIGGRRTHGGRTERIEVEVSLRRPA